MEPSSKPPERSNRLWSTLLKSLPPSVGSANLEFEKPIFKDGFLQIPDFVHQEGAKMWENHIVGFFLDRKMPFNYVKTAVTNKWKTLGSFEMALDRDLFYFKFSASEDREHVLDEGSFHLAGKLFVIRPWSREVENSRGMIKFVPTWVKMPKVPKDLWNPKGFILLGSAIGKPLFMDKTTTKGTMLSFARICIEIEPESELPSSIPLAHNVEIDLEYPWKPLICTKCKAFGHSTVKCSPPEPSTNKKTWHIVGNKGNTAGGDGLQAPPLNFLQHAKAPASVATGNVAGTSHSTSQPSLLPSTAACQTVSTPTSNTFQALGSSLVVVSVAAISESSEAYALEDGTLHLIAKNQQSDPPPIIINADTSDPLPKHKGKGKGKNTKQKSF
ncbi:hypothetical protein FRX31_022063 [Thalictrum thalictroides]|uniref:DUF4283 domain-containing protein n=1 Tax=Thalictrum thalictroides TaxID=46969 RepID=A0A7J6VW09_THATH|nr:hypothetical protein FRX31_022063 [Thalictrum thalictroides]